MQENIYANPEQMKRWLSPGSLSNDLLLLIKSQMNEPWLSMKEFKQIPGITNDIKIKTTHNGNVSYKCNRMRIYSAVNHLGTVLDKDQILHIVLKLQYNNIKNMSDYFNPYIIVKIDLKSAIRYLQLMDEFTEDIEFILKRSIENVDECINEIIKKERIICEKLEA